MRLFTFLSEKYALEAIKNQRLKVSRFKDLNDPFELFGAEMSQANSRNVFRNFKQEMNKKIGLLCFSRDWKNPLLWSHYADRHNGIALELEISSELIKEVIYSNERLTEIKKVYRYEKFTDNDIYKLLTTKFEAWKYEEEMRIFVQLSDCIKEGRYYFYDLNDQIQLIGIIHGTLCQKPVRDIAKIIPTGKQLQVQKARLAFKTFSVVRNKLTNITTVNGEA